MDKSEYPVRLHFLRRTQVGYAVYERDSRPDVWFERKQGEAIVDRKFAEIDAEAPTYEENLKRAGLLREEEAIAVATAPASAAEAVMSGGRAADEGSATLREVPPPLPES